MRIAAAIFVTVHGLGHVIWFMSTWTQPALGKHGRAELEAHQRLFLVDPLSTIGKALGILSLVVLIGFVASAWGIWARASWWPELLIGSAFASMPVLLCLWNPVKTVSIRALLANMGLGAATIMPWGDRFLGVH